MFPRFLGIIDLLAAGTLVANYFGYPIYQVQAGMGLALIMKGGLFINDILSWIDIAIGITMFVLLWIAQPALALIMALWLVYKGVYSFV